jgi:integrase/recombinase XerD
MKLQTLDKKLLPVSSDDLLSSLANEFLNIYNNDKTKMPYKLALLRFYNFLKHYDYNSIHQVDLIALNKFRDALLAEYSVKTTSMTLGTIKVFFKFLMAKGVINRNEASLVKLPRLDTRDQKTEVLTEREVSRMLEVVYATEDKFQMHSLKIMTLLLVNAGLRCDEIAHVKLSDIDVQDGRAVVNIKGKNSRFRFITLHQNVTNEVMLSIKALNIKPSEYLLQGQDRAGNTVDGKALSNRAIWNRVTKLAERAGINRPISPHSLRRTCATLLYKRAVPIEVIQRILGHENVATTHRYIDKEMDKEVSAKHALSIA